MTVIPGMPLRLHHTSSIAGGLEWDSPPACTAGDSTALEKTKRFFQESESTASAAKPRLQ